MEWPLSAWLSSGTALFLFFNVLVGAVAVMSRGQQGGHGRRLCRSASSMVLGRLRSFSSLFSAAECYYHTTYEAGELRLDEAAPERAVLEAVAVEPPSAPAATAAAGDVSSTPETRTDEAVTNVQGQQHHTHADEPSPPEASAAGEASGAVADRAGMEQKAKEAPTKSGGKRRARACRREAEEVHEGKAELNARADLFINQFREELKLQRLNSIINYTREMRRRAGAALLPHD